MTIVWIIALLLAIPTYGISLIVAFVIGTFCMKVSDDMDIADVKDYLSCDSRILDFISDELRRNGHSIKIPKYKLQDLIARVWFNVHKSMPKYSDEFNFTIVVGIVSKAMVYYEDLDFDTAIKRTEGYMFNVFRDLEKEGYYIKW